MKWNPRSRTAGGATVSAATQDRAAESGAAATERALAPRSGGSPGWSPRFELLHEIFEAQVDLRPDAIAVLCDGARITYLGARARALDAAIGDGPSAWRLASMQPTLYHAAAIAVRSAPDAAAVFPL